MVEHEHGLGRAQTVWEGAAAGDRLREQVFHAWHALARSEHLACRVRTVRRVHDRARLGRYARQVIAQVERHLPRHMQRRRRALRAKERLARNEPLARTPRPHDARTRLPEHASSLLHTGEHALFAREVLDFPRLLADAEDFGRKIDIGHVFENELVDAPIGNEHVHENPFHFAVATRWPQPVGSAVPLVEAGQNSETSHPASRTFGSTPSLGLGARTFNLASRWELSLKRHNLKNSHGLARKRRHFLEIRLEMRLAGFCPFTPS